MTHSAGILLFRRRDHVVEVLLAHPAGPIHGKKDKWWIPKGELDKNEEYLVAAYREFEEEVGMPPPAGELINLGSIKTTNRLNFIWALEGEVDLTKFHSNIFTMEWPPKSGKQQEFPENDRAEWFDLATAKQKLFKGQVGFVDRLADQLKVTIPNVEQPEQQSLL
jgi:predicted NUDIX family NTP pyrophosphohydrolase